VASLLALGLFLGGNAVMAGAQKRNADQDTPVATQAEPDASSPRTPGQSGSGFAVFDSLPPPPPSAPKKTEAKVSYQPVLPASILPAAPMVEHTIPAANQPASTPSAQPAMPAIRDRAPADQSLEYQIQLEPPGPQRLFQLESEKSLQERMRQEARERPIPERIEFPQEPIVSGGPPIPRPFPPSHCYVEPNYLCYGRLGFEQRNFERYGWDLCFVTPLISAGAFYYDLATLPWRAFAHPFRQCDSNAGYCLPGDPVPLMLYPPELTVSGTLAEIGTVVGLVFIF
jgi:hypothetical protein